MLLFGGCRVVECPKNEWTTIISSFASGIPWEWEVTFEAKNGGEIEGTYLEKRYTWIFPRQPTGGKLRPKMTFHRYWINAFYWVKVFPLIDVVAKIE